MLVAKFQRFGIATSLSPLELSWEKSKTDYRASLIIVKIVECHDFENQKCIRSTGEVLASLKNVHSSCIQPISPTMESEEKQPGVIATYAKMKTTELCAVLDILAARKIHYRAKNELVMDPLLIDGSAMFTLQATTNSSSDDSHLVLCKLCDPHTVLGKPNMKYSDLTKFIRNHAAAHQICTPFISEVCGLCCGPNCKLEIQITQQNRTSIKMGKGVIPPSALVQHNCITYPNLDPFPFKHCNKPIRGFPCTNMPVLCLDCPDNEVPRFVWSWSLEAHYIQHHSGMTDNEKTKYESYVISKKEKDDVKSSFAIAVVDTQSLNAY